ncbi:kinase-like domain-containing protein [Gilbertella persicaria]|uniref:kinase-like domain-containing protein n=1 Tax=Gilbertella persicaria TaxID=101096 RepID=UPI00221E8F28|nr:kinase-like domain-containing protein [Gilbertella persicaria]KAI8049135.1 kinase-like domain-containing protein [Gilbertella persicaria]
MSTHIPLAPPNIVNSIIGGHYKVGKKLGEGSFGAIFQGTNLLQNQQVAIKFEPNTSETPQLEDEYNAYKILSGSGKKRLVGVPNVYYFGHSETHYILIIDLLGSNLEELFDLCGRRFSVKTLAMLAIQMISRIQSVHERDLVYRDIKPDNFLLGRPYSEEMGQVFIVDFGMAKLYRDRITKKHIPYQERKSLTGTARYMSIHTHLGREQSRRDDLEALGHVFLYFLRGSLPWQGMKAANNKLKYEKIGEKKQSEPIRSLCEGYPNQLIKYMQYTRRLGFDETPDYDWLRKLFYEILRDLGEPNDSMFDWILLNEEDWQKIMADKQKNKSKPLLLEAPPLLHQKRDIIDLTTTQEPTPMKRDYGTLSKEDCKHKNHCSKKKGWRKLKSILTCST